MILLENDLFIRMSRGLLRLTCRCSSLMLLLSVWRSMSRKGALEKNLSRLLLGISFSLIYIVESFLGQWFIIFVFVFAGVAKFAAKVSGIDDVTTGVETDGQPMGRHAVVTRRLLPLAGRLKHDGFQAVHSRS